MASMISVACSVEGTLQQCVPETVLQLRVIYRQVWMQLVGYRCMCSCWVPMHVQMQLLGTDACADIGRSPPYYLLI
jgi:hypothetical protein